MKIGDVKVGEEYAALDRPNERFSHVLPRQVKVLEIVTVEEKQYSNFSTASTLVNKRRVKVEVLDETKHTRPSYGREALRVAAKGEKLVVEARHLVALWAEVRKDIAARTANEQKRLTTQTALEQRFKALGFKEDNSYVRVDENQKVSLSAYGADVEKLLKLAEAGKAAQK